MTANLAILAAGADAADLAASAVRVEVCERIGENRLGRMLMEIRAMILNIHETTR